jgi:hypothetical protein
LKTLLEYFRCPEEYAPFAVPNSSSGATGYFRFGADTICFGRESAVPCAEEPDQNLEDIARGIRMDSSLCALPFDPDEVVDNLRNERYVNSHHRSVTTPGIRNSAKKAYRYIRPFLPVPLRRHLQRVHVRSCKDIRFPNWPVDRTVDKIFEKLLVLSLKTLRIPAIPFIWFWPEGHSSCAIVTHDVEAVEGRDFCSQLMTIDDRRGIKSAFQIVPEERYEVSPAFLREFRDRGFEVNVHDLNHDGDLFSEREQFLRRAARINEYGRQYGASGFRSGVLYRNPDWYDSLEFSYDMSIPNVAHLEAQRGGCCTVMPFFIGKILELPLTTAQDYALFHLLGDHSLDLWMRQIRIITEGHGLVSCIAHPDYIIEKCARGSYESLLDYLAHLRSRANLWLTLPREVDRWWRERSAMQLVRQGDAWQVEGPGKERARIAWARLDGERLVYSLGQGIGGPEQSAARPATAGETSTSTSHLSAAIRP